MLISMAKRKPKTVPMYLRIEEALKKAIESRADNQRRPVSQEISIAIEKHLEENGEWPPQKPKSD